MGKNKSGSKKGASSSTPAKKCTCDHPYQCSCGNRPERPSKGHKWDPATQQWGGKGHKQKGASGQTATVAQAETVTAVGNVAVKQWQKLPSKLLADLCKKNSKEMGMPVYRPIGNRGAGGATGAGAGAGGGSGKYRFRLIVPSTVKTNNKGEHDVVLAPSLPVDNEEQAKEEAALLGLLFLFPKLPHERTLPEPYRSTYLVALKNNNKNDNSNANDATDRSKYDDKIKTKASKNPQSATNTNSQVKNDFKSNKRNITSNNNTASSIQGATANTQLTANIPSFHQEKHSETKSRPSSGSSSEPQSTPILLTRAQRNEARLAHQREIQAKIRKHEAIRNANKPMEVFMSARFRKRIERLLTGDYGNEKESKEDDNCDTDEEVGDCIECEEEDVIQSYVIQRLVHEGFTKEQSRKAYRRVFGNTVLGSGSNGEEKEDAAAQDQQMDSAYEQTLQNLLIHSKEEDLPIGFDPRGGNLDVIIPTASAKGRKSGGNKSEIIGSGKSTGDSGRTASSDDFDADTIHFARHLGLTPNEAFAIISAGSSTLRTTDESFQKEERKEIMHKCLFWESICKAASFPTDQTCLSSLLSAIGMKSHNNAVDSLPDEEKQRNQEAASEELEALEAIFSPEEFSVRRYNLGGRKSENSTTIVSIAQTHPTSPESNLYLEIHYVNGLYPSLLPTCLITFGEWGAVSNWEYTCGANIHLKIIEFISTLTPGEECIFTLFGHLQSLLQDEDGWNSLQSEPSKLLSSLNVHGSVVDNNSTPLNQDTTSGCGEPNHVDVTKQHSKQQRTKIYRPREKNTFWNKSPRNTTPAEPFPKLPAVLDRARKSLPAAKARDEFLALLEAASTSGRVTLVTGETGCGKTTQIPQYILEANPKTAKIIVAQPRRLAATGVASRVALERGERSPGMGSIGYVVRGDSKLHADTRLVFCTTGVLLRQLQSDKALENISHIVIDEVHERHLDSDVLLAILKQTLPLNPSLQVILMSATMDADRFARYWGPNTPRMHIPGFTYPVRDFMLEDVLSITNYVPPKKRTKSTSGGRRYQIQSLFPDGEEGVDDDDEDLERNPAEQVPETRANACAVSLEERLSRMNENEIDYDLIAVLIETLLRSKKDDGSILVFLPGAGEIDRAEKTIQHVLSGRKITTLPLHGGLQPEHQQKVFIPANKGFTKIILSTNVAETSITIPDCTIVIDTCKEKQSSFDPINRMPLLLEQFASKDSLKQRRGRAGRVREGSCYKLITSSLYRSLPEHGEPEIRRCALDQSILSLLFLGLENGSGDFLRVMLDPPSKQSIQSAFDSLEKVGAVARSGDLLNLTPLGTHLAGIPAPPTVGKLIVMGYLLGCRDLAIDIAAGMSVGRSPFLRINTPFRNGHQGEQDPAVEKQERNNKRILEERALLFKTVGNSDHALLGLISKLWDECRGAIDKRELCDRYGLNFNSMKEISQLVRQLDLSLNASGFVATEDSNKYENSWRIVRSAIVAALSPNQVVRVQRPTAKYTETVEGAVEKEGKAKDLKFFIRGGNYAEASGKSDSVGELFSSDNEERVFLHPSSSNFATGSFSCPWLVYHRLVRTSKAFISDSTECNPYALLLFGGTMEVEAAKGIITIDNWVKLSANARIGSLIGALRQKVDDLLEKKIANPSLDITNSTEMSLIRDLLRNDGLS